MCILTSGKLSLFIKVVYRLFLFLLQISICEAAKLGETRDITFTAAVDRSTQHYLEKLPENFQAQQKHHVLIGLHGHGSDRWQGVGDRDEFRAAQDTAAKYNMIYVSPDYRASTSWMGPKAEADVVQIINELRGRYKVGKIFLSGGSMGASAALTFTARHPDLIAGVCAQNGTANHLEYQGFQDAIRQSFGGTKAEIPLEYKNRSAEYWPEKFTMPVALTAGGHDTSVPPHSVLRLAGVLRELKRSVLLIYHEEGGHSTNYDDTLAGLEFVVGNALK